MLIDPTGSKLCPGLALAVQDGAVIDGANRVDYLIGACDPPDAPDHACTIDGVTVRDCHTRDFLDDAGRSGVRYSCNGSIAAPLARTLPGRDAATQAHLGRREFIGQQTITPRTHRARAGWAA